MRPKTGSPSQVTKTPARKRRDAKKRRRQEAKWAQRSSSVTVRTMTDDDRDRMA